MTGLTNALVRTYDIGGPVVALLIAVGVVTIAVIFYKIWQFWAAGVGRHRALQQAITSFDAGDRTAARAALDRSTSYLAPVMDIALSAPDRPEALTRITSEAETRFAKLERGLRLLDSVAQLAPLLGLFGTVLGMIEAFQSLQAAGSQVDPTLLAGGIWVALLTTAVGLAVAMPTAVALSWFESRMDAERVLAEQAISTIRAPIGLQQPAPAPMGRFADA
ncbi:Biopolymer transport protein ExbB [Rhodobacteraceae bacterium THAF1]|uniref:MotA/TolQ/ExbB proton channel family protein n=1 Tax=Palleronia sp. THAF1 TaxID=2587842 RepID=UPI000F3E076B|nr:MotA/TolQ/ExbB proton channel family protein [Palleronia sp. THAF1]QFU08749.1 Biopolymer transport protein ExbB [Palleronia sp. THAF1]VDC31272.1 Biopolymer transport protein ExbB [Rhodobacteraceae bacterium THAF1]